MKYLKMLGLAAVAVAALALPGMAGANPLTSPTGTGYTSTIKAESEGATTLHDERGTVVCEESNLEGKVESHGSTTASGKASSLTFGGCNYPVEVLKAGSLEVKTTTAGHGTVFSSGAEIRIKFLFWECVYSTNGTDVGTLTGSNVTGSNATLDIGAASIPRTGGSYTCSSSATWTGSYKVTTPSTLYIGHPVNPLTSEGASYTGPIKAESEGALELHGAFATVKCGSSTLEGNVETFTSSRAGGKVSSLTFGECNYPVTVLKPGSLEIHGGESNRGTVTSSGAEITIQTSVGDCIFTTNGTDVGTLTGSNLTAGNATLDINSATIPRTGGEFFCGSSGIWTGSYKVTTPSTLVVGHSPVTSPQGASYTGPIKAESEGALELHGAFATVKCGSSTLEGAVETFTASKAGGKVSSLTFGECNYPVTVLKPGSLEIHAGGSTRGTVTSSGAEITIQTSVGDCIFTTNGTDVGTLTDSTATGGNATLDINSASIPTSGGNFFCGSSGTWTGSYKVTTPSTLYVH